MHPHGVFYTKADEGAPYVGNSGNGNSVAPGATHLYTWQVGFARPVVCTRSPSDRGLAVRSLVALGTQVPESAGPAASDGSSAYAQQASLIHVAVYV